MNGDFESRRYSRDHGSQIEAIRSAFDALTGTQTNSTVREWVHEHFPTLFTDRRVGTYLRGCSVNHPVAIGYHPNFPRFLYTRGRGEFEIYDAQKHGAFDSHGYGIGSEASSANEQIESMEEIRDLIAEEVSQQIKERREFAYESHLRDFLARNLTLLEEGLSLWTGYSDTSVEYRVGTKRIDILAKDRNGNPVIVELKLSRGHESTVGQALFYRAKLKELLGVNAARIIMVAGEITEELRLAASEIQDVDVFSYALKMDLQKI